MNDYTFHRRLDGVDFYAPSTRQYKKYDAYVNGKKYSFGDTRYHQYYDAIGYYSKLNHYDDNRRYHYIQRHQNDLLNNYSSGYFSLNYLW